MRVLCVHNQFEQYGGADAVFAADEKMLARHGEVVTYTRHSKEIVSAAPMEKLGLGVDTLYSRRTVREVTDLVKRFRPEIAYVHNVFPLISPSLYSVLYRLGVPSVHIIHDYRLFCPNSRFYINDQICELCKLGNYWSAVRKRCVRGSTAYSALYASSLYLSKKMGLSRKIGGYICLTEFTKSLLLQCEVPEDKLYVCPNYIDTSEYTPQFGGGEYVLYLGGLYRDKGVMTAAKAFAKLPHIPFKFVGTGAAEQELRDFIASNQLSNLEVVGFKAGQEKLDYLRNSMFTIVPSPFYETFGMVVLEAYASGKPVVASAIGSLPYIVHPDQTGLLFQRQDADDLAAKIGWLFDRPEEIVRMGRNARSLVESKYDSRLRYPSLQAIFENVIKTSRMN
ncbi:MAG: glycosyltransferase family 4 protein [Candidatus Sulfotelmatobacter sp.]